MNAITSPAFRYHGGKFRLAPWIIDHFPPHRTYVEPFGGAAGVLLQKPRAYAEIYNDLDDDVFNFFAVVRDPIARARLIESLVITPYARREFDLAYVATDDAIERARRLCIRASMGFGSAGATKGTTGFRLDSKRAYGTAQHVWAAFPANVAAVGERFTGVLIENRPAIDVMRQHDDDSTLHYVDPPYVHETRTRPRTGGYRHEMTDDQHRELLAALKALRGMVIVSGYPTELYDLELEGWHRNFTAARISAVRGTKLKTECIWMNPLCFERLNQGGLFSGDGK